MDENAIRKLVRAYKDDRAVNMWYNMQTGKTGIETEPNTDARRVNVVVMGVLPVETCWYKCACVNMWGVFKSARMFIHEYMQPIYDACITLNMLEHANRVHTICHDICADEGEGFVEELLDVLVTCGAKTDAVSVAVHHIIKEYISDMM